MCSIQQHQVLRPVSIVTFIHFLMFQLLSDFVSPKNYIPGFS